MDFQPTEMQVVCAILFTILAVGLFVVCWIVPRPPRVVPPLCDSRPPVVHAPTRSRCLLRRAALAIPKSKYVDSTPIKDMLENLKKGLTGVNDGGWSPTDDERRIVEEAPRHYLRRRRLTPVWAEEDLSE